MSKYSLPNQMRAEPEHHQSTACKYRTELIPRHTRAKTISGKWMYLLEYSAGPVQNVEVS